MTEVVSKQLFLCGSFYQPGNHTIHVSFDIVPVYNTWIYYFNVKEIPCSYNYTLQAASSTQ